MLTQKNTRKKIFELYTDGGVIERNPSRVGGSWAYALIAGDRIIRENGEIIQPLLMQAGETVTNNQTELLACIVGIRESWQAGYRISTLYTDSQVTLGRLSQGWSLKNIPAWMIKQLREIQRDPRFALIHFELVKGHAGNKWNEYCDHKCQELAQAHLVRLTSLI